MNNQVNSKKSFLAPFWCMLLILLFQATIAVDYLMTWYRFYAIEVEVDGAASQYSGEALRANYWFRFDLIVLTGLLIETILYYHWRKRILNRSAALIHVACLFLNFFVWPALGMLTSDVTMLQEEIPTSERTIAIMVEIGLITVAHIAFFYLWLRGLDKPAASAHNSKSSKESADGDGVEELHDLVD
ncbi:hypothetical protein [Paraflavitalea pollutisoli]|uniref:hypothetical protein n=1 Tax=Paraflavitalea pollutisoli TaxID=3034143 RepID=UPI0023ECF30C|nr:hypothetical protein [Paraflavitalea sp. H1-2-19X]